VIRATGALVGHSLRRFRGLVLGIAILAGGFQALGAAMATAFRELGTFDRLLALVPPFLRDLLGPSLLGVLSFTGIACIGYFHVAIIAALIGLAIAVGTEPTAETERRFSDLLLSRPVPRHAIISRTLLVLVVASAAVLASMFAGTELGLAALAPADAPKPPVGMIGALSLNLWTLMLCWGSIAAACGAAARRRTVAGATAAGLALITMLVDYMGKIWPRVAPLSRFSPFHYYNAIDVITGHPMPASHPLILVGTAAAGFVVAYLVFARRDV
jgi:ABC-2 type transport system permease protein